MNLEQIGNYTFIQKAIEKFLNEYDYVEEDTEERIEYLFWKWAPERCKDEFKTLRLDRMYELSVHIVISTAIRKRKKLLKTGIYLGGDYVSDK